MCSPMADVISDGTLHMVDLSAAAVGHDSETEITLPEEYTYADSLRDAESDLADAGGEVMHDVACMRLGVDMSFAGAQEIFGFACQGSKDSYNFVLLHVPGKAQCDAG